MTRPPTILVPIDFSGLGDATLAVARKQAQALDAQLHLLHVLDLRPMRPLGIDSVPALDLQDELQEDLRRRLRSVADETTDRLHLEQREAQLHQAGPSAVRSSVRLLVESSLRIGDPAEEILACAREIEPRLIVMGTHGRRGLARLWLGSTTEEVLRRATCPVLSVHPTEGPSTSEQPPVLSLEVEHLLPGLRRALRVRDCVRRDAPRVAVDLPAREVLQRLALHDGLPLAVVDAAGEWLGTIHEAFILERLLLWEGRDLSQVGLSTVERLLELQRHLYGQSAGEIMSPRADELVVEEGAPLAQALERMLTHGTSSVMVLRRDHLVGVLRGRDVLRSFLEHDLTELMLPLSPDRVIELARQILLRSVDIAATELSLTWEDDLLCVAGRVSDLASLRHAESLLRRVPGVQALENRLVVEPPPPSEVS